MRRDKNVKFSKCSDGEKKSEFPSLSFRKLDDQTRSSSRAKREGLEGVPRSSESDDGRVGEGNRRDIYSGEKTDIAQSDTWWTTRSHLAYIFIAYTPIASVPSLGVTHCRVSPHATGIRAAVARSRYGPSTHLSYFNSFFSFIRATSRYLTSFYTQGEFFPGRRYPHVRNLTQSNTTNFSRSDSRRSVHLDIYYISRDILYRE